tara:strand:- start:7 stop:381 length:375 start_codon:yes stop_codon:yes gene_type:complete
MSFKRNKSAAIRKFFEENPNGTARDAAKAAGCDMTYVYLVRANEKKKLNAVPDPQSPPQTAPQEDVTRGQEVLRRELMDKDKTIAALEAMLQKAEEGSNILASENTKLNIVIKYLEGRINGASV